MIDVRIRFTTIDQKNDEWLATEIARLTSNAHIKGVEVVATINDQPLVRS
jgi:hypothetical protein